MRTLPISFMLLPLLASPIERSSAQSLARRVSAARGTVEVRYAPRPGVCGDGHSYYRIGSSMQIGEVGSYRNGPADSSTCVAGPVRARLRVDGGTVSSVQVFVGPAEGHDRPDTDLGEVPSAEAADFLLRIAESGNGWAADGAIGAAVLADGVSVWRRLLAIARDTATRSRGTRQAAAFWAGRFAAARSVGHGEDLAAAASDDRDHDDPRNTAVFALSQLKNHEGVPSLLQIARAHRDPELRKQALFWLGESGDPRGLALFEEILLLH